eukprot:Clim_evm27s161 gene=Clim_evmTU27s161
MVTNSGNDVRPKPGLQKSNFTGLRPTSMHNSHWPDRPEPLEVQKGTSFKPYQISRSEEASPALISQQAKKVRKIVDENLDSFSRWREGILEKLPPAMVPLNRDPWYGREEMLYSDDSGTQDETAEQTKETRKRRVKQVTSKANANQKKNIYTQGAESIEKMPMADWFDPMALLSAIFSVVINNIIGDRTDTRPLHAIIDQVAIAGEKYVTRRVSKSAFSRRGSTTTGYGTDVSNSPWMTPAQLARNTSSMEEVPPLDLAPSVLGANRFPVSHTGARATPPNANDTPSPLLESQADSGYNSVLAEGNQQPQAIDAHFAQPDATPVLESIAAINGQVHRHMPPPGLGMPKLPLTRGFSGFLNSSEDFHSYVTEPTGAHADTSSAFFFDMLADTGDGWNPTFSVARLAAQPSLTFTESNMDVQEARRTVKGLYNISRRRSSNQNSPRPVKMELPRGRLLLLAGDLVYPEPTPKEYNDRFVEPFRRALCSPDIVRGRRMRHEEEFLEDTMQKHPHMFAVPGNHDWLDGLVSFRRLFCNMKTCGGWLLPQRRSYFAIELPHHWWIFGLDDQLNMDLDEVQYHYFRSILAEHVSPDAGIVIITHRPWWILDGHPPPLVADLIKNFMGTRLRLIACGDMHYYSRYSVGDEHTTSAKASGADLSTRYPELVVCGGGGAFLHPTTGLKPTIDLRIRSTVQSFHLQSVWPSMDTCRNLMLGNLIFPLKNTRFGYLTAIAYAALVAGLPLSIWEGVSKLSIIERAAEMSVISLRYILSTPLITFVFSGICAMLYLFTASSGVKRMGLTLSHSAVHLALAMTAHYIVTSQLNNWTRDCGDGLLPTCNRLWEQAMWASQPLFILPSMAVMGYVLGPTIFGWYLTASSYIYNENINDAFAALKIEDYKSMLRMAIEPTGDMTLYAVGIPKTQKNWPDHIPVKVDPRTSKSRNPLWYAVLPETEIKNESSSYVLLDKKRIPRQPKH